MSQFITKLLKYLLTIDLLSLLKFISYSIDISIFYNVLKTYNTY